MARCWSIRSSSPEEVIYQRALVRELPAHSLEFSREVWMDIHYKGEKVGSKRVDFVIDEAMVEIKAKATLEDVDFVQTLSYVNQCPHPHSVFQ